MNSSQCSPALLKCQATLPICVELGKELVKVLWAEVPIVVESHRTASMFVEMNILDPYTKERVWYQEEPRDSAPRLHHMQEDTKEQGKSDPPTELATCSKRVSWPYHAVAIFVEPYAVLFEDLRERDISINCSQAPGGDIPFASYA